MSNPVKSATLKPKEERRLLRGHAWAYRNEFQQIPADLADGAVVDVFSDTRRFVGRGYFQATGGIAVRLVTRHQEEIDGEFFARRLAGARALRERLFPGETVYRWLHGESDELPGLVADRYGSMVMARAASSFYAECAPALTAAFLATEGVEGVVLEAGGARITAGSVPESLDLTVDGVRCGLRPGETQKTGLFLDQRRGWAAVRRFAAGARVFDGHCYHGLWSCNAALAGAASVFGVDSSQPAVDQARANAEMNGVQDRCFYDCESVETALEAKTAYDVVIIDPPAFAKNQQQVHKAMWRYEALNVLAMGRVAPGGVLFTSSCSHFVEPAAFLDMLKRAGCAAHRRVSLLEMRGASPDHPVLLSMPETAYLKCAVLRVE